ncbi:MAG: MerC domain-containing protein [Flammeovirgaceae bacterium]
MKSLFKLNLDNLGICISSLCALHCLITPFLLILLPFASLAFLEAEGFEIGMIALSFVLALASLVVSYFRNHRNTTPMMLAGVGFIFFALARLVHLEAAEILLSIIGGACIVIAHYRNRKLLKSAVLQ